MPDNKKPPVLEVVNGAKSPKASGKKAMAKAGGSDGGGGAIPDQGFSNYQIRSGSLWRVKQSNKDNETAYLVCNFVAWINEEITVDNGLADSAFLRIEGRRCDGLPLPAVDVPSSKFFSTQSTWPNDVWGTLVFISVGVSASNVRAATQLFSGLKGEIPRGRVYKYMGWKQVDNAWCYLHGAGAINAAGLVDGVQVDLGEGHISRYQLTAPLSGDELKQAVADALDCPKTLAHCISLHLCGRFPTRFPC